MRRPKDWDKLKYRLPRLYFYNPIKIKPLRGSIRGNIAHINIMKKRFFITLSLLFLLSAFALSSCGDDDDGPNDSSNGIDPKFELLYNKLFNTSWRLESTTNSYSQAAYQEWGNAVISFSAAENFGTNIKTFEFYISGFGSHGYWYIGETGTLWCINSYHWAGTAANVSAYEAGLFSGMYGSMVDMKLSFINDDIMILSDGDDTWRYNKISYQGGNTGGSSGNGSGSGSGSGSYEAPEIGFYDFTATKSSITAIFQIYNQEACGGVTSAKIYYGTSSPSKSVSATVSGKQIRATITGLKAGTKYMVKCTANSPGGSTSSSTVSCITNY